jgi:hypothetical protein
VNIGDECGEVGSSSARHSKCIKSTGGVLAQTAVTLLSVTHRVPSQAYTPLGSQL